jgi:F-type H+-transporting ATPase subunit b
VIPDVSVLWVIFFVLLLLVSLDRFLFKPVMRVRQEREHRLRSAREAAEEATARLQDASARYEKETTRARMDVLRELDERRREALGRRADLLTGARREAEVAIAEARARVAAQSAEAQAELSAQADSLGEAIVERVLGRSAS